MSFLPLAGGKTVTIVTRTRSGRDALGNDTFTETQTNVAGCAVAPRNASEIVQGQDTAITGIVAYLPPGTAVDEIDAVIVDGLRYEVDGVPGKWSDPFSGTDVGIVLVLNRVTG